MEVIDLDLQCHLDIILTQETAFNVAFVYWARPAKGCYTSQTCSCSFVELLFHTSEMEISRVVSQIELLFHTEMDFFLLYTVWYIVIRYNLYTVVYFYFLVILKIISRKTCIILRYETHRTVVCGKISASTIIWGGGELPYVSISLQYKRGYFDSLGVKTLCYPNFLCVFKLGSDIH